MDVLAASKYLQFCKTRKPLTLEEAEAKSFASVSTISRYINGNIKSINDDVFLSIITAYGGSMEEYEKFKQDKSLNPPDVKPDEQTETSLSRIRAFYDDSFEKIHQLYQAQYEEIIERKKQETEFERSAYETSIEELKAHHEKCLDEVKTQCEKRVEETKSQCAQRIEAEERFSRHMRREKNRYFIIMCVVIALYAGQWLMDALLPNMGWLRKGAIPDIGEIFSKLFG